MTTDGEAWRQRYESASEGQRFFRSFSKFDLETVMLLHAPVFEERIFNTIQRQFDLGDFKVRLDEFPLPCQKTLNGRVQYTFPDDRDMGVPVAVLKTNTYTYEHGEIGRHIIEGFCEVVDQLSTDIIDFLREFLENTFGDEYLDRRGELWFFGRPCFNWETSLSGIEIQVSCMVGGMFTRSGVTD